LATAWHCSLQFLAGKIGILEFVLFGHRGSPREMAFMLWLVIKGADQQPLNAGSSSSAAGKAVLLV